MNLKRDEEEILKVLLKLYNEQNKTTITGSFSDFPIKYQIIYKEILLRLQEQKFIKDFEDYIAEDFMVTLLPPALNYFAKRNMPKTAKVTASGNTYTVVLGEMEALISIHGGEDQEQLTEIAEEMREFCDNLKDAPTVQPRRLLMKKIAELSPKYPWLLEKITKALGLTMIDIMAGN